MTFNLSRAADIVRNAALLAAFATLALVACEEEIVGPRPVPLTKDFVFVTGTDFQSGSASVIWIDSTLTVQKNVAQLHSDAVARFFDGRIYVVNRFNGDNIQVLDPSHGFKTIKQFSVGNGADPHDFLLINRTRAFVTRYNETELWVVDPTQGRRVGTINFAWLADGDFIPEMDHMVRVGNRVFVSVQRVDRDTDWGPVGQSYLAVIDAYSQQFIDTDPLTPGTQALRLTGTNPFSEIVVNPVTGDVTLSSVGRWTQEDGGIEVVDPAGLTGGGFVLTEAQAGGDITDVVMIDANRGAAIVTDANFNNLLVGFDLSAPASIDTLYAPGTFSLQDAELSADGLIFLTDRTPAAPGIRVFRSDSGSQVTTTPIDVGLPPFDIEFGVKGE